MLKVSDLKIDAAKTVGTPLVLCRTQPTMAYEEGVRTTKARWHALLRSVPGSRHADPYCKGTGSADRRVL